MLASALGLTSSSNFPAVREGMAAAVEEEEVAGSTAERTMVAGAASSAKGNSSATVAAYTGTKDTGSSSTWVARSTKLVAISPMAEALGIFAANTQSMATAVSATATPPAQLLALEI
jgi:hypothetical protein